MKGFTLFIIAALSLSASALAAAPVDRQPTSDMDDVHTLGVVYVNHNRTADAALPPQSE